MQPDLKRTQQVVLDLDGAIHKRSPLLECTRPLLARPGALRIGTAFLTSNTSRSQAGSVSKPAGMGVPADSVVGWENKQAAAAGFDTRLDDPRRRRATFRIRERMPFFGGTLAAAQGNGVRR